MSTWLFLELTSIESCNLATILYAVPLSLVNKIIAKKFRGVLWPPRPPCNCLWSRMWLTTLTPTYGNNKTYEHYLCNSPGPISCFQSPNSWCPNRMCIWDSWSHFQASRGRIAWNSTVMPTSSEHLKPTGRTVPLCGGALKKDIHHNNINTFLAYTLNEMDKPHLSGRVTITMARSKLILMITHNYNVQILYPLLQELIY